MKPKLPSFLRALDFWSWVMIGGLVFIILGAVALHFANKRMMESRAAKAAAESVFQQGRARAGADAVNVVIDNAAKSDAFEDRVKGSEDAIRNADPADRDAVAVRELCRSPSARGLPECRVQ